MDTVPCTVNHSNDFKKKQIDQSQRIKEMHEERTYLSRLFRIDN